MIIRKAIKEDFEQYWKLQNEYLKELDQEKYYHKDISVKLDKIKYKKHFNKIIKKRAFFVLVIEEQNNLLGLFEGVIFDLNKDGDIYKKRRIGYVDNVFIKKNFRKKGLFAKLQKEFENYLKIKQIKHCFLNVSIKNIPAYKSYLKKGFKIQDYKMHKEL